MTPVFFEENQSNVYFSTFISSLAEFPAIVITVIFLKFFYERKIICVYLFISSILLLLMGFKDFSSWLIFAISMAARGTICKKKFFFFIWLIFDFVFCLSWRDFCCWYCKNSDLIFDFFFSFCNILKKVTVKIYPVHIRNTGIAFSNVFSRIGAALSPYAVTFFAKKNLWTTLFFYSAACIIGIISVSLLPKEIQEDK